MVGVVPDYSDKQNHERGHQADQYDQGVRVELVDYRIRRKGIINGFSVFLFLAGCAERRSEQAGALPFAMVKIRQSGQWPKKVTSTNMAL